MEKSLSHSRKAAAPSGSLGVFPVGGGGEDHSDYL